MKKYQVGVYEERGGYMIVEAKNKKEAEKIVFDHVTEDGFVLGKHIKIDTTHREVNTIYPTEELIGYCKKCDGLPTKNYEVDLCEKHYNEQDLDKNGLCLDCKKEKEVETDIQLCQKCMKNYDTERLWKMHDNNELNALDFNESAKFRERFRNNNYCPRCIENWSEFNEDKEILHKGTHMLSDCKECGVCKDCEHFIECSKSN